MYYAKTDAVVLVVDSVEPARFASVRTELMKLISHPDLARACLLVMANKQDLQGAMPAEDIANALSLPTITTHSWTVQGCSALTQQGIREGFDWLAEKVQAKSA